MELKFSNLLVCLDEKVQLLKGSMFLKGNYTWRLKTFECFAHILLYSGQTGGTCAPQHDHAIIYNNKIWHRKKLITARQILYYT
jgi:hypothetical protein